MILVDDADGRADLVALLDALAEKYTNPATRVVLLARAGASLVASLTSRLETRHEWIVARAPDMDLQPQGGRADWDRWFGEAVTAFAAVLNVPVPDLPALSHEDWLDANQPILVMQAQALLAVLGARGEGDSRKLSFGQVADALMKYEKRRWRATAATWSWPSGGPPSEEVQERSIAALVLLGSGGDGEAEQIVSKVAELRDAVAERLSAITSWISALYSPGPGGRSRIRPDMVGEWFVVSQLTDHPALAESLRDGLTDAQAARALAFLARAADRMESASKLFDDFASGDLSRRILAAAQAAATGEVGRYLLDAIVAEQIRSADGWTIDQLSGLDRLIPGHVLLLTHVAISTLIVRLSRAVALDNLAAHQADLAGALKTLGYYLGEVGRYQDALAATGEAVTIYRALAEDNLTAHRTDLARALNNLGGWLRRVGRYQDALAAAEELVTFHRGLAEDNPAAHQADLAGALNNLGVGLDEVGRYQDALAATEEAVTIRRALAEDNPAAHQAALGTALNNLGNRLDRAGRYQDALAATEEAVTIRRALAEDNPAAYQADLAGTLDNLGIRLGQIGRYQDALAATEEAVTIRRALAEDNPAAHQAALAAALNNLGIRLGQVGRYQDALAATEEAVTIRRALAEDNPAAHQAAFSTALNNLGIRLGQVGRYQDALAATEEAVTIRRALAEDNPAAHQAALAAALDDLGNRLGQVGRYQDALAAGEEAVTIRRALAEDNPAAHQAALARSLHNLGNHLSEVGRDQEVLSVRTESVNIYRELASKDPDLYQNRYRQHLAALRREYERRGMHNDAMLYNLDDPPDQPPPLSV